MNKKNHQACKKSTGCYRKGRREHHTAVSRWEERAFLDYIVLGHRRRCSKSLDGYGLAADYHGHPDMAMAPEWLD
jgi:hypothetical protein